MREVFDEWVAGVAQWLRAWFASDEGKAGGVFPAWADTPLGEQVAALTLRGGKRVRPALLLCGYELVAPGAPDDPDARLAAVALELLQTYFLIHDDIMDGDVERRGGPAVHAALAEQWGDARLGEHLGVLAGDLACALHEEALARMSPSPRAHAARRLFAAMHRDVVFGQFGDMTAGMDWQEITLRKTASYTTVGPMCIGAALAGASEETVSALAEAARPLGVAFQLTDDLVSTFGSRADTGKPQGSDLRNKTPTAMVAWVFSEADPAWRTALQDLFAREELDDAAVEEARRILEHSGARAWCRGQVDALTRRAVAAVEGGGFRSDAVKLFAWFAQELAGRCA